MRTVHVPGNIPGVDQSVVNAELREANRALLEMVRALAMRVERLESSDRPLMAPEES